MSAERYHEPPTVRWDLIPKHLHDHPWVKGVGTDRVEYQRREEFLQSIGELDRDGRLAEGGPRDLALYRAILQANPHRFGRCLWCPEWHYFVGQHGMHR